ncbi:MAG: bepF [Planctomycetaceae bacterium]|nr:bepF [Planctomycetaceae bacterium]
MNVNTFNFPIRQAAVLVLISLVSCGCNSQREKPARGRHKIVATSPQVKAVMITQSYVCQIEAQRFVKICASERGNLDEVAVKEGQMVKEGDLLFKLRPVLSQAKLDAERATVKISQLEANTTKLQAMQKMSSEQELAIREAELDKAKARERMLAAKVDRATVTAPFGGIIQRIHHQKGTLVEDGDVLTTLSDSSSIWANFDVPETRYFEFMADRNQNKDDLKLELVLANGTKFKHPGKLGAIVADFNNRTGTIPFRADFPNPDRLLRKGQTGNVLIHRVLKDALVIPHRAVFNLLDKRYVFVVDNNDVVHQREIEITNELEDLFVIKQGVGVNDKIVLDGVMQIQDGEKIEYEDLPQPVIK